MAPSLDLTGNLLGGLGAKINNVRVRCGHCKIMWTNLFIAAARMQSHVSDMHLCFPAIERILRLERLRHRAKNLVDSIVRESSVLRLVALRRPLAATDARDKIFALLGSFPNIAGRTKNRKNLIRRQQGSLHELRVISARR